MIFGVDALETPSKPQNNRSEDVARWALFAIIAGMLALPMVPGWQGLTRLLAAYALYHALAARLPSGKVHAVLAGLALCLAVVLTSWINSATTDPGRHFIGTLTDVYGLALPLYGGIALTVIDLILIAGLASVVLHRVRHRAIHTAMAFAVAVWVFSLTAPLVQAAKGGTEHEQLAQMLAGSSEWAIWVLFLGLAFALMRTVNHVTTQLLAVTLGGVMMAAAIALQFAVADYAYVLDAARFEEYFYRVRGTAYYHAPATYTVAIALLVILGLFHGANLSSARKTGMAALAIGLAAVACLNDTRGLNLALIGGLGLFAVLMLLHRDWKALGLSIIAVAIISSNMLYMKPAIGGAVQGPDVSLPLLERLSTQFGVINDAEPTTDLPATVPIIDGSLRVELIKSGLRGIKDHPFVGSGVGTLDLAVSRGENIPLMVTYSSHALFIDMALMAGVPALLMFLAMCGLAFMAGAVSCLRDVSERRRTVLPGLLGALVVIGIGAVFLPQEMNNIVALFFLFSALLLVQSCSAAPESAGATPTIHNRNRLGIAFTALLGLAVMGWAVLTSPTYTLPVLNLVARHAADIEKTKAKVYVSTPLAVPLARSLLQLRGVTDPDVQLLPDDPAALPRDNAFIIWHPATDWRFPALKAGLPYRFIRPNSTAPSVEFPPSWWMLESVPYAGFLMQAGVRPASEVFTETPPTLDLPKDLMILPDIGRFIGVVRLDAEELPEWLGPEQRDGASPLPTSEAAPETATISGTQGQDAAAIAQVARNLTDANPFTIQEWTASQQQAFIFDLGADPRNPIAAYRFVPSLVTPLQIEQNLRWHVLGSADLRNWQHLDSQSTTLQADLTETPVFSIANPRLYRYLAVVFDGQQDQDEISSLGDIELYPSPLPLRNTP